MNKTSKIFNILCFFFLTICISPHEVIGQLDETGDRSTRYTTNLELNGAISVGNAKLWLKPDGNLVFMQNGNQVWESNTANQGVTALKTVSVHNQAYGTSTDRTFYPALVNSSNVDIKVLCTRCSSVTLIVEESGFGFQTLTVSTFNTGDPAVKLVPLYGVINFPSPMQVPVGVGP